MSAYNECTKSGTTLLNHSIGFESGLLCDTETEGRTHVDMVGLWACRHLLTYLSFVMTSANCKELDQKCSVQ